MYDLQASRRCWAIVPLGIPSTIVSQPERQSSMLQDGWLVPLAWWGYQDLDTQSQCLYSMCVKDDLTMVPSSRRPVKGHKAQLLALTCQL